MKHFVKISIAIIILLGLTACEDRLNIQTNFPFEVKTMPVPKSILKKTDGRNSLSNRIRTKVQR